MKKILTILTITLTLTLTLTLTTTAQTARPLRVYLASGVVDKMALSSGSSMFHSRLDLDGVEHDDYVSLVIADADSERRYMLSQVDSLVMPNGRRVVFQGSMTVQPSEARLVTEDSEVFNSGSLRSSFSGHFPGQGQNNVTFYWTENDRIRLDVGYESRARQLTNNNTNAQFVFDNADLDAASYTVYYPGKSVTILSEQTQTGANNSDHIGPSGDCGTATATLNDNANVNPNANANVNDNGAYSFTLQHKAAYLCFLPHIDYLPSVRIEKIVLTCNTAIAGTYQLASGGLYNGTGTSKTVTLNLVPHKQNDFFIGHNVTTEQDSCAAYMVIAPQDGSRSFTATYYLTDTLSRVTHSYIQTFSFQPLANTVYPITCHIPESTFNAVDLGFSHCWSSVNVGSLVPSETGDFYTHATAEEALTGTWQLPTKDNMAELLDECTWQWGEYNGIEGWLVTGTNNGNDDILPPRIFLPSAGYWEGGVIQQPDAGYFWLASDGEDPEGKSKALVAGRSEQAVALMNSTLAMNVRAVKDIAREFRIPYSGTQYVDLRTHGPGYSIKVYDHAGPDASYSNGADGYLIIRCAEGYKLNISGPVDTEGNCDPFVVYDVTADGDNEVGRTGGNTTTNITTNSNEAKLYFHSDGSSVRSGLNLTVTIQRKLTDYDIIIPDVEGGTLAASKYVANPEDTITLTATPAAGYVLSHIKVESPDKVLTLYEDDPRLFQNPSSAARHYLMCDTTRVRDGNWWHDVSHFLMPYSNVTVTPVFVKDTDVAYFYMAGNGTQVLEREFTQRLVDAGVMRFRFFDYKGDKNTSYDDNVRGYMHVVGPVGYRMKLAVTTHLENSDHLYAYDGNSTGYRVVGDANGSGTYSGIMPYNYDMFLYFYTDGSVNNFAGFDATLSFEKDTVTHFNMIHQNTIYLTEEHIQYLIDEGHTYVTIYDSGGPNGNYSSGQNDWCYITLPEGYLARVSGTIYLEPNYEYICVLEDGTEKYARTGEGTYFDYSTSGRTFGLHLRGDNSGTRAGYGLKVEFVPDPNSE